MPCRGPVVAAALVLAALAGPAGAGPAQEASAMSNAPREFDRRAAEVRHLNLHYSLPRFETLAAWDERARELRQHVLASAGLLPMPVRTPLNPRVWGTIEGDDYTIQKVTLETLPGFYLGGNLYRPKGRKGPFPGIANPHGHWKNGRLEHQELGSIPARCITFARMGCVAFAYDMTGYNDTDQVPHTFGGAREALWGISLAGLQLWNSIRVLDYLQSLPDVDSERLACTGASGGGTQTFLLCAVDDRVKVAAPVNMISAHMQGGCLCENPPNLRVDATNVEIGALMAPRPLLMVAATGDWTKNTLTEEFPAIQSIYRLMGAEERVGAQRFDAPHNYNRNSREAVYAWMGKWLLGSEDAGAPPEPPVTLDDPQALRVFTGQPRPADALDAAGVTRYLIAGSEGALDAYWPRDAESWIRFRDAYAPALRHSLGAAPPKPEDVLAHPRAGAADAAGVRAEPLFLERRGQGDRVPALLLTPAGLGRVSAATLVIHPEGIGGLYETGRPAPLVARLLEQGGAVILVDAFLTGEATAPPGRAAELEKIKCPATYNRTDVGNRVQDILTTLAFLRGRLPAARARLVGVGEAGLWSLLALALDGQVDAAALDLAGLDLDDDAKVLEMLNVPCLRRAGDLRAAAALSAPGRLLLHHAHPSFPADLVVSAYAAAGLPRGVRVTREAAGDDEVLAWLAGR